ncbi:phosphoribosylamine--glycine ligase [Kocuria tytonicola]|uniref:Phosphoribosylamine--glycine ligase n=1 Tax=Kocuria tytonicola TaxID=2055946 RepID=A0A3L9L7W9_9MICC|nr:phosphoribosylamine--glycine ligase [Kocuria tytonicola]RLY94264.1 phosphoribosylamine--glycine ligase [Kocuria tytonicola]
MKVLVVGPGGREHAMITSLLRDPHVSEVHAAPGNAGIAQDVPVHPLNAQDPEAVVALARELAADLVVVGPEAPLVAGVADALREAGIPVFGPSREAARIEGSKAFAKEVMAAANVPTARAVATTDLAEVREAFERFGAPHVVKDDGLAAGKGVVVTEDRDRAEAHARECLDAGGSVLVEEYLDGPEVSLFVLSDGTHVVPLLPAQDFKRVRDGDQGPNTGGMGAYTPLDWLPEGFTQEVVERVARPVVDELRRRGTPFTGVLYCGLAVTAQGVRVIEFNARFGDPETQSVLAMLETPLGSLLLDAAQGRLCEERELEWRPGASVTIVLAAKNYPGAPRTGDPVTGLDDAAAEPGVHVCHAGTVRNEAGEIVSAGGRVLTVVAHGADLREARERGYRGIRRIGLDGSHHRGDIALAAAEDRVGLPPARPAADGAPGSAEQPGQSAAEEQA